MITLDTCPHLNKENLALQIKIRVCIIGPYYHIVTMVLYYVYINVDYILIQIDNSMR